VLVKDEEDIEDKEDKRNKEGTQKDNDLENKSLDDISKKAENLDNILPEEQKPYNWASRV